MSDVLNKCEALSSNPNTAKKKKKWNPSWKIHEAKRAGSSGRVLAFWPWVQTPLTQKKERKKTQIKPDTVVHFCNPITWEVEAGGLQVQGQPGLYSETLS
jgi:hypothetical protein